MRVAAVFTTYNRKSACLTCIDRLLAQTMAVDRIVVVVNGSVDGTGAQVKALHGADVRVELIELPENIGNSAGVALAIERALGQGAGHVWILDDDSWPQTDALEKLLRCEVAGVRSSLIVDPETGDISWPYGVLDGKRQRIAQTKADLPGEPQFEIRGAWLGALIGREIIEEAGPPDGDLFLRGEDEEYPARIRSHGHRFYCVKDSLVDHPSPVGFKRIRAFGRNYFYECEMPLWKAYYVVRNQTYIRRRYAAGAFERMAVGLGTILLPMTCALLFDNHKARRIGLYFSAGWDGWRARLGKTQTEHGVR